MRKNDDDSQQPSTSDGVVSRSARSSFRALSNCLRVISSGASSVAHSAASAASSALNQDIESLKDQLIRHLERGVPAMVAAFTTRRLMYPSQAFDLIHCSSCRINWTRDDGILLLEVNRMLRRIFCLAAQPVYKHEKALEELWEGINHAA